MRRLIWAKAFLDSSSSALNYMLTKETTMPVAVKAPKRKVTHAEPDEDSFAGGIIKGLQDFKEGRVKRFKDAEELTDYLRNL